MKLITFVILLIHLNSSYAKSCEVYGISDSPQKLSCTFTELNVNLTCKGGVYFLNTSKVELAFHLEVEDGPTPLVFKSREMEMTVVLHDNQQGSAELLRGKAHYEGTCL